MRVDNIIFFVLVQLKMLFVTYFVLQQAANHVCIKKHTLEANGNVVINMKKQ